MERRASFMEDRTSGKIFAIGDIHGCVRKLTKLIERLPLDSEADTLVFLGDYIDRGPNSREVIDILLDLEQRVRHTVFLLGNHEHLLLRYARGGDPDDLRLLRLFGVEQTLDSYGHSHVRSLRDLSFLPESHRAFLNGLREEFRAGDFLFVHAGVLPAENAGEWSLEARLNVRKAFFDRKGPSGTIVVFGHTAFETPFLTEDKIGIDTGAVYGNLLTAVELPAVRFYHA